MCTNTLSTSDWNCWWLGAAQKIVHECICLLHPLFVMLSHQLPGGGGGGGGEGGGGGGGGGRAGGEMKVLRK